MSNEVLDTRTKILQTTIDIVGLKGEVTIREITEKAGVNVAAINYHFGNKNNLLKEVENYYSDLLYNSQEKILKDEAAAPREILLNWAHGLLNFMFSYPALIGLIVNLTTEDKSYNPVLIQKIYLNKEIQVMVEETIKESTGIDNPKLLNYKYLQLFSGILGPVVNRLVTQTFDGAPSSMDFNSREELDEYIGLLIESVVGN